MKQVRIMAGSLTAAALALAVSAGAFAHGTQGGGQGMMQGGQMGGGMMGQGMMGPGMMHGGRMSGGMMGPGMMQGGQGMMQGGQMGGGTMGPGVMGQGMMGPGMMGGGIGPYAAGVLGLSEAQRGRLEDIQRENAREHWQLMQELMQRRHAMMDLYRQGQVDPDELGRVYEGMADVQRRMLEHRARMHNEMLGVLTEEQRGRLEEMRRFGQGGYQ